MPVNNVRLKIISMSMIVAHVDGIILNNSTYYLQHPQVQQLRLVAIYNTKIFS